MPLHEAARRQADGDRRQHRRQQRRQAQELLGAFEGAAHLGPRVVEAFDALAAAEARFRPFAVGGDGFRLAGQVQAPGDPAADLDQLRGRQVAGMHHQARRDVEEIHAAVRLQSQYRRYGEAGALPSRTTSPTFASSAAVSRSSSHTVPRAGVSCVSASGWLSAGAVRRLPRKG
jgi:hypothetical protein